MRSKRSFHFVSFKMETLDLYSWLFTHSNCLYALNSLNRGILFSKSFVQMSNELFILCVLIIYNKVRLIPILRTFSQSIFGRGIFSMTSSESPSHTILVRCHFYPIWTIDPVQSQSIHHQYKIMLFCEFQQTASSVSEGGKWLRIPTLFGRRPHWRIGAA